MSAAMDIVDQLRRHADATARATQMISDAKSSRNEAAGDVGASYRGLRAAETVEWKAAAEIEQLRALLKEIDATWPVATSDLRERVRKLIQACHVR